MIADQIKAFQKTYLILIIITFINILWYVNKFGFGGKNNVQIQIKVDSISDQFMCVRLRNQEEGVFH